MTEEIDVGITPEMAYTIKKFLEYSFEPVDYEWDNLTAQEKALCGKEEFDNLVKWLRNE